MNSINVFNKKVLELYCNFIHDLTEKLIVDVLLEINTFNMNSINVFNKKVVDLYSNFIHDFTENIKIAVPLEFHTIMDELLKTETEVIKLKIKTIKKQNKKISDSGRFLSTCRGFPEFQNVEDQFVAGGFSSLGNPKAAL